MLSQDKKDNLKQTGFLSGILLVQILATVLVILGHSYPFVTPFPRWLYQTRTFLYIFHMPLFVWISGYLLVYTGQSAQGPKTFLVKRFNRLLIPYIFLTIIAVIPKLFLSGYLNRGLNLDTYSFIRIFFVPRENTWGHLWFLPMIFFLGLLGFYWDRFISKRHSGSAGWLILTLVLFLTDLFLPKSIMTNWFAIKDMIKFGWYFAFGGFIASTNIKLSFQPAVAFISSGISLSISLCLFFINAARTFSPFLNATIALLMIYSIVVLCNVLSSQFKINRNAVYAETFLIFLLSWPCQAVVNVVFERILHLPYYFIFPLQFFSGIISPIILIVLLTRYEKRYNKHHLSFLLGKNCKK